jgi:hypothetical protein
MMKKIENYTAVAKKKLLKIKKSITKKSQNLRSLQKNSTNSKKKLPRSTKMIKRLKKK